MDRMKTARAVFLITVNVLLNVLMAIPWDRVADFLLKKTTTESSGSQR